MTTIDYGTTPYTKLKRQQLLTLAYALEDMRDRSIQRHQEAEDALFQVREACLDALTRDGTRPRDSDGDLLLHEPHDAVCWQYHPSCLAARILRAANTPDGAA